MGKRADLLPMEQTIEEIAPFLNNISNYSDDLCVSRNGLMFYATADGVDLIEPSRERSIYENRRRELSGDKYRFPRSYVVDSR